MNLITELTEQDIDLTAAESYKRQYRLRKAARAVIIGNQGKIPLLHVAKHRYHKLPGGGVDPGETLHQALHREAGEEVGAKIKIGKEIGVIIEYRNKLGILQISYCYHARLIGQPTQPEFTKLEKSQGFEIVWVKAGQAIKLLKNDQPTNYEGKLIRLRDLSFLRQAIK